MHSSLHVDILICPQSWMFLLCADPLYITCGCYLSTLTVLHTVSLYWGSPTCRTPYVKLRAGLHRPTYLLSFLRNNIHLDQSQRSIISHDNCSSPIGWRQAPSSLDIALLARPHEPLQALCGRWRSSSSPSSRCPGSPWRWWSPPWRRGAAGVHLQAMWV